MTMQEFKQNCQKALELGFQIELAGDSGCCSQNGIEETFIQLVEEIKTRPTTPYGTESAHLQNSLRLLAQGKEFGEKIHFFVAANVALERFLHQSRQESEFLISSKDNKNEMNKSVIPLVLVLENIRSAFNVGSIIRSAESFSAEKIYLTGYTSTPDNKKTGKTTMSAEEYISWEYQPSTHKCIDQLKEEGYTIVAAETAARAFILNSETITRLNKNKIAILLGNERFGLRPSSLKKADHLMKIPLTGVKNSLNVSNAASIIIYEFAKGLQVQAMN